MHGAMHVRARAHPHAHRPAPPCGPLPAAHHPTAHTHLPLAAKPLTMTREKLKAPVPLRSEAPPCGLKSDKNFITTNAVDVILAKPKKVPQADFVWTSRPGYGKAPLYLRRNKQRIAEEREYMETYLKMRYEPVRGEGGRVQGAAQARASRQARATAGPRHWQCLAAAALVGPTGSAWWLPTACTRCTQRQRTRPCACLPRLQGLGALACARPRSHGRAAPLPSCPAGPWRPGEPAVGRGAAGAAAALEAQVGQREHGVPEAAAEHGLGPEEAQEGGD